MPDSLEQLVPSFQIPTYQSSSWMLQHRITIFTTAWFWRLKQNWNVQSLKSLCTFISFSTRPHNYIECNCELSNYQTALQAKDSRAWQRITQIMPSEAPTAQLCINKHACQQAEEIEIRRQPKMTTDFGGSFPARSCPIRLVVSSSGSNAAFPVQLRASGRRLSSLSDPNLHRPPLHGACELVRYESSQRPHCSTTIG